MGKLPERERAIKYPQWQIALQQALIELDKNKLEAQIATAEAAISKRQKELSNGLSGHGDECRAIEDAQASLRFLKRQVRGAGNIGP